MKLPITIALGFLLLACQANAITTQPTDNNLIKNDMKTCYGRLNELKKLNPLEFRVINKKLMTVVQSQAFLNASEQYASPETMSYIKSMQTKTIRNTCIQINQKLDMELIKKTMTSMNY